jgi:hypothetical protein
MGVSDSKSLGSANTQKQLVYQMDGNALGCYFFRFGEVQKLHEFSTKVKLSLCRAIKGDLALPRNLLLRVESLPCCVLATA